MKMKPLTTRFALASSAAMLTTTVLATNGDNLIGIGHAHRRIADSGDLDVTHILLEHGIEAEEGEKQVRLDAFHAGAVSQD